MSDNTWTKITVGGQPVLDSRPILGQMAYRPDWADELDRIHCPVGAVPGGGKFLIAQKHFDLITTTGAVDIVWTTGVGKTSKSLTFKNYLITRAFAALPVTDSPLVVSVADPRQVLRDSATVKRYNVAQESAFESDTINAGTAYTWAQLFENLWAEIPSGLVDTFATSSLPATTPRDVLVLGDSAWEAIVRIARQQGLEAYFDPFASKVTVTDPEGAASNPPDAKKISEADAPRLAYANVPHTVRVFFAKQKIDEAPHHIDVATGDANAPAGSKAIAWGSALAQTDSGGAVTNIAILTAEADEVAAGVIASRGAAAEPSRDTYTGIHASVPGPGVTAVSWRLHPTSATVITNREWEIGSAIRLGSGAGGGTAAADPHCGYIRFEIVDAKQAGDTVDGDTVGVGFANATVKSRPCGCVKVPQEIAGKVKVYDPMGCHLAGEDPLTLPGRQGSAKWMKDDANVAKPDGVYDEGYNFRSSLGFATDGADETHIGELTSYPPYGWENAAVVDAFDRDNTVDRRLAGYCAPATSGDVAKFTVDLPEPGIYLISLAMGDVSAATTLNIRLLDDTTEVAAFTNGLAIGQHADAMGVVHTTANWVAGHTKREHEFTSTKLTIELTGPGSRINHLRIESASKCWWEIDGLCC